MEQIYQDIIQIAQEASEYFAKNRNFEVKEKTDAANLVTSMDVRTQHFVMEALKKVLPEAVFFAEENDVREMSDGSVFVIDPIDGTTNYAYDLRCSCISIALLKEKEPVFGVIVDPYHHETFVGIKGEGAWVNGEKIHVSSVDLEHSLVIMGTAPYHKHMADETFKIMKEVFLASRDIRRSGSAALDLVHLAQGKGDAFFERFLSPWDYAAGSLIVKEAGGIVTTLPGYEFKYDQVIPIIAATPSNIDAFLKIVECNL